MKAFRREVMRWERFGAMFALIVNTVTEDGKTVLGYTVEKYGSDGTFEEAFPILSSVGHKMEEMLSDLRRERLLVAKISGHGIELIPLPENIPKLLSFGELQGMGYTHELRNGEIIQYLNSSFDIFLRVTGRSQIGYRFEPALTIIGQARAGGVSK